MTLRDRLTSCLVLPPLLCVLAGCTTAQVNQAMVDQIGTPTPVEEVVLLPVVTAVAVASIPVVVVGVVATPIVEPDTRQIRATAARNEDKWGPSAAEFAAPPGVVAAELRHHLPPPLHSETTNRLVIRHRPKGLFRRAQYHVTATGNFTPEHITRYVDAVKRLQGHLDPEPEFHLVLRRDQQPVAVTVGEFTLK